MRENMAYAIALAVVVLAIWGIVKSASGDRYSKMTEEEFEAEARRGARLAGGVAALQKVLDPSHKVEYAVEAKELEADAAESGDRPDTGPQRTSAEPPSKRNVPD
jgi:hypothetical protein